MKKEEKQLRRDKIVNSIKYRKDIQPGLNEALTILARYLKERGKNNTPERNSILTVIYHIDGPFDVDALHQLVCEKMGYLCRVTIYNSLMLFVEAGVVQQFQPFANGSLFFERCIGQKPHGYQICRHCGSIRLINMDEVIEPIANQVPSTFHTAQYCLYVIGLCANCYKEERHEIRLKQLAEKMDKDSKQSPKKRGRKRYTSIKEVRRDRELAALKKGNKTEK